MGKSKVRKRVTIRRQFVVYYILVLAFSLIAAFTATTFFYAVFHHFMGHDSMKISHKSVREVVEYVQNNGDAIRDIRYKKELDKLVRANEMEYYIKDMNDKIIYTSTREDSHKHSSLFWDEWSDVLNNSMGTSSISIPLVNKDKKKIDSVFVLIQYNRFWFTLLIFIDLGIPFSCFVIFTLLFAGRVSRKIKNPLNELMAAVKRIKQKDLDFNICCTENNEIGDLSAAFEDMRSELKGSLIREWQLEQDRREMVSAITHDIRTPLAIIQGHVEGLQEGLKNDSEKLDSYLCTIEQNTFRVKRLIDEMNELAEIDSFDFTLYRRKVDLERILNKKIAELSILAERKKIRLTSEITDTRELKTAVQIDSDRLEQTVDNIVGNSIRFTPEGGTISLNVIIEAGRAYFRFCDTGPGFGDKDIKALFRKFYKGDLSRSKEKGHSGLGLYIAKMLVEKHGGEIKASNSEEGGACLEFWIEY